MFTECTEEKIKVYCPYCIIMPVSLCLSSHLPQINWASLVVQWQRICLQWWKPGFIPGLGRSPGEGSCYPLQLILPGEFHGQRSLVGYSTWGYKESYMTELAHTNYLVTQTTS